MEYDFSSSRGSLALHRRSKTKFKLIPNVDLVGMDLSEVVLWMPESVARENLCLPVHNEGETMHVAHHHVDDVHLQDKLRFILNRNIKFHHRPKIEIMEAINFFYGQIEGESADSILQEFTDTAIDFTETLCDAEDLNLSSTSVRKKARSFRPGATARTPSSIGATKNEFHSLKHNPGDGMFYYTVEEGRKALAYRKGGKIEVVEGPARIWKGWNRIVPMKHFVAHPGEFMLIRYHDGTQEHRKGPSETWLDPRIHEDIHVQKGLTLAAKEAVVVYGEDLQGATKRRICYGPGVFVPKPGEWLHNFSWHSSDGGSSGVEKRPNGLQFQKMWLMPDQMYHDVPDVRTADDAVLVIRLMIFFELLDIEKMLDTTHDPIGDFINAATSDVVEFTGKLSFEEFKKQTEHLNELSTYSQLLHRAEQSGYQINNVVYRGYGAPESLQKMHDEAIAARTSLQLERDTEKQTQELEDYRLQCQVERSQRRRVEQTTEVEHDISLQEKREAAKLDANRAEQDFLRVQKQKNAGLASEIARQKDTDQRQHLDQLRAMGVELTEYLTQGRADQVIELRGQSSPHQPHLHIQQNGNGSRNGKTKKAK